MKKTRLLVLIGLIIIFSGLFVSCDKEDVDRNEWRTTSISYMLTISPDLLKFVSPEVTYVDSEGKIHTISGVQELDRLVNVGYAHNPFMDVWTIQTIKGTNYKAWTLNMTFKERPFHSYFGVKYKKQEIVEDTTGVVYDFHHSIFSTTILAASELIFTTKTSLWKNPETTISFGSGAVIENHISFTKDCYYTGGEVEKYVDELVNTPDKIGFYIDSNGAFKEKNDFPL